MLLFDSLNKPRFLPKMSTPVLHVGQAPEHITQLCPGFWPAADPHPSHPVCFVSQVPYDDLRYLFGEIMYGGHITDDWDRRLCRTYLEEFIKPEMLEGELFLAPGFPLPGNMDYNGYHQVCHKMLRPDQQNML